MILKLLRKKKTTWIDVKSCGEFKNGIHLVWKFTTNHRNLDLNTIDFHFSTKMLSKFLLCMQFHWVSREITSHQKLRCSRAILLRREVLRYKWEILVIPRPLEVIIKSFPGEFLCYWRVSRYTSSETWIIYYIIIYKNDLHLCH